MATMFAYRKSSFYKHYRHQRRVIINSLQAMYGKYRYGDPAKTMRLIGITGTDGKTTTATMLASILQQSGRKVGLISTVEARINNQSIDTGLHVSTPGPIQNYALLAKMRDAGVQDVVIETTSHGLDQRRVFGLRFDIGIVTNIAPEHLDYHRTMANYIKAKSLLLKSSRKVVLNADDDTVRHLNRRGRPEVLYGFSSSADIRAEEYCEQKTGAAFTVSTPESRRFSVQLALPGKFNVSNALAAVAAAISLGVKNDDIAKGLEGVKVAGRWEVLQAEPFMAVVDFAHTPQAFEQLLPTARELLNGSHKLIHVFGSAAQRDEAKRSTMGELSGKFADYTILTMEDPRYESLDRIQGMLIEGLERAGKNPTEDWVRIDDRRAAIRAALEKAASGDLVLITGKGHEKSLSINGIEHPWSDIDVTKELLKENADE